MPKYTIVAQFHDYNAAHRTFCELLTGGIEPHDISLIAGDRSNSLGANRDFGILAGDADFHIAAVRRGTTLLAVRADDATGERVARTIQQHSPAGLADECCWMVRAAWRH